MEVTRDNWRVGDKVKQKIDSYYYHQSEAMIGTIIGTRSDTSGWISVEWSNDNINSYRFNTIDFDGHLLFAEKENININLSLI